MPIRTIRDIQGIRQNLEIAFQMARFQLKTDSVQTYVGFLWWLAEPALNTLIYWFLIVQVFGAGGKEFVPYAIVGLVVWRWLQRAMTTGSNAISKNAALMRNMHHPKLLFVTKELLVQCFHFFCGLMIIMVAYALMGYLPNLHYLLLPVHFLLALCFVAGVTALMSAIIPFVPDLLLLYDYGFRLLMFVSCVFYEPSRIPERFRFVATWNPLTYVVSGFRDIMMYGTYDRLLPTLAVAGIGLILGLIGIELHRKYNRIYPRIVR